MMKIDDDTVKQLLRISDELLQLCKFLNEKRDTLYPCGRSYPHSDRSGQEKITLMQPYKGYFIQGSALLVHPFSPDWYIGGSVLVSGHSSSFVEITRFQLQRFTVSIKELAEWFGLEVARLVVDECLAAREN
jgi:hypothetical protein